AGHRLHGRVDDARTARGDRLAHPTLDGCRTERQLGQSRVREAHGLQPPHTASIARQPVDADFLLSLYNLSQTLEEPGIEACDLVDPIDREALAKRLGSNEQPIGRNPCQRTLDLRRIRVLELTHAVEPAQA